MAQIGQIETDQFLLFTNFIVGCLREGPKEFQHGLMYQINSPITPWEILHLLIDMALCRLVFRSSHEVEFVMHISVLLSKKVVVVQKVCGVQCTAWTFHHE